MKSRFILLSAACLLLPVAASQAGKNASLKPVLGSAGKTVAEESFAKTELDKNWTIAKGDWQVADGALVGKEKPEDKHPGVLALNKPNHDSIIQFSLKLDGATGCDLSYNHPKGHLFRIVFTKTGFSIHKDADKNNPSIKAAELGKAAAKFDDAQWVTVMVEVKGTKVAVQTDTGAKAEGSDPSLDVDKTGYRFVVKGASIGIDDVKVSEIQ